jgi:uncharacterized membrane protein
VTSKVWLSFSNSPPAPIENSISSNASPADAFHTVYAHAGDFDSITIEQDRVVVEKKNVKEITTTVFQRYWAQVNVRDVAMIKGSNGKCGLFISSHGNEVEFGRNFINDEQRSQLARDLRQKLKNIN